MEQLPRILITGFEPFGTAEVNPTEKIVLALPDHIPKDTGYRLDTLILPVTSEASDIVINQLRSTDDQPYDFVLHLGLNMTIEDIALERVAVNIDDYRIPDNKGDQVMDRPIDPEGPAAYFSTLPTRKMERALREQELPCHISYSAGTYLCNHLLYTTLNFINCDMNCDLNQIRAGFLHVPSFEHMEFDTMLTAILITLESLAGHGIAN